jgi:glycoprotein-N-acetylgalactosamine 3-beta-galactosyltransferase
MSDEEHLRLHPHPGAGAKDEQGRWGYIHDAQFLRRNPDLHPFTIPDHERDQICAAPGQGPEGNVAAYKRLTEIIQILPEPQQNGQPIHDNKLFCAVYTHPGGDNRTGAGLETWARRCDGFLAASTVTDAARGLVNLPHYGNYPGQYNGIWQKVRSMMTYIYENYGSEYDYFHFNGDDTFVIVENLKAFLHEKRPRFVGVWFKPWWVKTKRNPFTGSE